MKLKSIISKYWPTIAGAVAGAIGGYIYWLYIGCESGTCPITSSPLISSIWGALIGGLILNMIGGNRKTN